MKTNIQFNLADKVQQRRIMIIVTLAVLAVVCFMCSDVAFASSITQQSLGSVAKNITHTLGSLARLITAGAYVAGFGFAVGAILKFKAHKDNPTQIPVGTPVALLFIAAALIFLPAIFGITGKTMFGTTGGQKGTVVGVISF